MGLRGPAVHAQELDSTLWGTTGNVIAVARSGNTLYLAGSPGVYGPNTGGGIPVNALTGEPVPRYPRVTGHVSAATPDGAGGWFIGGDFRAVGGLPRSSLAHILADGSVASWAPSQDAPGVFRLVLSGTTLYVVGNFNVVDGRRRIRLAAFDATTGELLPWDPDPSGSLSEWYGTYISSIAVRADTVFVGGNFTQIGRQARVDLAALDGVTGDALAWYPGPVDNDISALALRGNTLYVGGYFTHFAGRPRQLAAAIDVAGDSLLPWNPDVTAPYDRYIGAPFVSVFAFRESAVYIGGRFQTVGGQPRMALAAVDADSGSVLPWNPNLALNISWPYPVVGTLLVQGDTVFVGGYFDAIGGEGRRSLGAVDLRTGEPTRWNPWPAMGSHAGAFAASGDVIYVGGTFSTMGPWQYRNGLAALDLTTGRLKDWNPNPNGAAVMCMVASGGTVYVGGSFTFIGGAARSGIAALDTLTGAATAWNPSADQTVTLMTSGREGLLVGGLFSSIGGQPRRRAAALDTATGLATDWNPNPNDYVGAIAQRGRTVYMDGFSTIVGDSYQYHVVALDDSTGTLRRWTADLDGVVRAIAVTDSTVFLGGEFITTVNGEPRIDLAALDASTGQVRPWNAHLSGSVTSLNPSVWGLLASGHTLYVAGDFDSIGGQVRPCLAALDDSVGLATEWAPRADFETLCLAISGNTLYAGGKFGSMSLLPSHGIAALTIPLESVMEPPRFAMMQSYPNPARTATTIRFSLPAPAVTTLTIYDVQGRRVARPLDHSLLQPGPHDLSVRLDRLRPGVYLYRLEAGKRVATRKMLVVR